jgi:hypothetical protein
MTRLFVDLLLDGYDRLDCNELLATNSHPSTKRPQPHTHRARILSDDVRAPLRQAATKSCLEIATRCPQPSLRCCPPLVMHNATSTTYRGRRVTDEASRSQKANLRPDIRLLCISRLRACGSPSFAAGSYWRLRSISCEEPSRSCPTIQVLFCVPDLRVWYAAS